MAQVAEFISQPMTPHPHAQYKKGKVTAYVDVTQELNHTFCQVRLQTHINHYIKLIIIVLCLYMYAIRLFWFEDKLELVQF